MTSTTFFHSRWAGISAAIRHHGDVSAGGRTCSLRMRTALTGLLLSAAAVLPSRMQAQLSTNPDKFLGNITTSYNVDYGKEAFHTLWNQITPENESKWSSIEGSRRGSFNWGSDAAYNYAKKYGFPFKFHCLIWGAQYPGWVDNLSTEEQYKAIVEWMDAIKARYPDLPLIDVVNEAVSGHQPAPYKAALGGDGKTGYDWIIKAFEMAHERWPNAILIYNDYNTFQWQRSQFISLVRTLRDAGAPIDAYGCQSHDLTDMSSANFQAAMKEIQNALKMPMYSTEYDIGTSDDALQLQRYKEQIPYMWEADYCAGITLWGYIYGRTWTTDGNSGIIKDGADRPAMAWLREYMKTDAAKNAKSPFPGMVKEASVYVKPATLSATKGESLGITVRASMRTKTIEKVELYVKRSSASTYTLLSTMTEAPYVAEYTPLSLGAYNLKAVVTTTDGTTYERLSGFSAYNPRSTFKDMSLPGTVQFEDFDKGGDGVTFHDSNTTNSGTTAYRTDGGGVDIVQATGGYALGYTETGEWMEYTVNVKEPGLYAYDVTASSGNAGSAITVQLNGDSGLTDLTGSIAIPCVQQGNWDLYRTVHGRMIVPLDSGRQVIRVNVTGGSCNLDKMTFARIDVDAGMSVRVSANPAPATVGEPTTISVTASSTTSTIAGVRIYVDDVLLATVGAEPFQASYQPRAKGTNVVTAEAVDAEGRISPVAKYTLKSNNPRTPYGGLKALPGIIEFENFDGGGEGFTFHDSDTENQGDASTYRSDGEGIDFGKGNGGTVIGYTARGEWMEYSVDVKEAGLYSYEATVSSGTTGSGFTLAIVQNGIIKTLARVNVPQTGNSDWTTYTVVKGSLLSALEEGPQLFRVTITGANCNIDKIELKCTTPTAIINVEADAPEDGIIYNLAGQRVDENYKGIVIRGGRKYLNR
jgi:GH35 family endo-1,4-beta-xylanase